MSISKPVDDARRVFEQRDLEMLLVGGLAATVAYLVGALLKSIAG